VSESSTRILSLLGGGGKKKNKIYLNHASNLFIAANDRIKLAFLRVGH